MARPLPIKVHLIGGPLDGRDTTIERRWPSHPEQLLFSNPADEERVLAFRPPEKPISEDARMRVLTYRYAPHTNEDALNVYYAFDGLKIASTVAS